MRGAYLRGGLFHFEKAITSLVHKQLGYKVEMLKYKKIGGHATSRITIKSKLAIPKQTMTHQSTRCFTVVTD